MDKKLCIKKTPVLAQLCGIKGYLVAKRVKEEKKKTKRKKIRAPAQLSGVKEYERSNNVIENKQKKRRREKQREPYFCF